MVLTGYRLHSLDMKEIQSHMGTIEEKLHNIAFHEYHKILGQEMIFLFDSIAINAMARDKQKTIYDIARENVDHQITVEEALKVPSAYNFQIFAYIMSEGEYTYFEVMSPNPKYLRAFASLEDYSVDDIEAQDDSDKKVQTWARLHKKYQHKSPIAINFTQRITPQIDKIKFPSYKERCASVARHNISNHYLNEVAGGSQIPPHLLMRDFDRVIELLDTDEGKYELRKRQIDLTGILVDTSPEDETFYTLPNQSQSGKTTFDEKNDTVNTNESQNSH